MKIIKLTIAQLIMVVVWLYGYHYDNFLEDIIIGFLWFAVIGCSALMFYSSAEFTREVMMRIIRKGIPISFYYLQSLVTFSMLIYTGQKTLTFVYLLISVIYHIKLFNFQRGIKG